MTVLRSVSLDSHQLSKSPEQILQFVLWRRELAQSLPDEIHL